MQESNVVWNKMQNINNSKIVKKKSQSCHWKNKIMKINNVKAEQKENKDEIRIFLQVTEILDGYNIKTYRVGFFKSDIFKRYFFHGNNSKQESNVVFEWSAKQK